MLGTIGLPFALKDNQEPSTWAVMGEVTARVVRLLFFIVSLSGFGSHSVNHWLTGATLADSTVSSIFHFFAGRQ